ncbi:MAG: hypothetical protein ACJAUR_002351, partial [Ulvibacter sp.]
SYKTTKYNFTKQCENQNIRQNVLVKFPERSRWYIMPIEHDNIAYNLFKQSG